MAVFDGLRRLRVRPPLAGFARRAHRMAAALGAAFTTAVRMVDRVHRGAADVGPTALPAIAAGLADHDVHVIGIADLRRSSPGRPTGCGEFRRWAA